MQLTLKGGSSGQEYSEKHNSLKALTCLAVGKQVIHSVWGETCFLCFYSLSILIYTLMFMFIANAMKLIIDSKEEKLLLVHEYHLNISIGKKSK